MSLTSLTGFALRYWRRQSTNVSEAPSAFPSISVPPNSPQFKRIAAFTGDWQFESPRRLVLETMSQTQDAWAYRTCVSSSSSLHPLERCLQSIGGESPPHTWEHRMAPTFRSSSRTSTISGSMHSVRLFLPPKPVAVNSYRRGRSQFRDEPQPERSPGPLA